MMEIGSIKRVTSLSFLYLLPGFYNIEWGGYKCGNCIAVCRREREATNQVILRRNTNPADEQTKFDSTPWLPSGTNFLNSLKSQIAKAARLTDRGDGTGWNKKACMSGPKKFI
jgi:hypothetical protein